VVKAQSGYNYQKYGITVDGSYERGYTNLRLQQNHASGDISFVYNYSPFLPVAAEFQFGTLSGGGLTPNLDPYGKRYTNHYEALVVHGDFQFGQVVDFSNSDILDYLKNFYVGTGIGIVINNNNVQRTNIFPWNGSTSYVFPGKDKSVNMSVPLRFGYEIKIYNDYQEPYMAVEIGYVHSYVFGEGLDGYNDPPSKFKNQASDQYRQIVIGVKFNFGTTTSFTKPITRF
jgi:hypothetical protein